MNWHTYAPCVRGCFFSVKPEPPFVTRLFE